MQSPSAIATIATPIGLVELSATDLYLTGLRINPATTDRGYIPAGHRLLAESIVQIEDWFAGRRTDFNLPLMPAATPRGADLRSGIAGIGYGETLTYGELAKRLNSAARAVGQACRRNPFPIIIPCHRVKSTHGQEFYSGGAGPRTKAWLIAFERGDRAPFGSDLLL